jgi:hypothetical protein
MWCEVGWDGMGCEVGVNVRWLRLMVGRLLVGGLGLANAGVRIRLLADMLPTHGKG